MRTRLALSLFLAGTAIISCSDNEERVPLSSAPGQDLPPIGTASPTDITPAPGDGSSDLPGAEPPVVPPLSPWGANSPFQGSRVDAESFPLGLIVSGGVAKDGIPALTNPAFVISSEVSFVAEHDLVLGLVVDGVAKAYPENIGWWHEIVNDEIGGKSVSVTFCPLTGTGLAFAAADGGQLELGVSGRLYNNNLVMYDRRDGETLYPQLYFTGIHGSRKGESLTLLPVVETTWRTWKRLHPDTEVVAGGTYAESRYTRYPYGGYRTDDEFLIFSLSPSIDRNRNTYAADYGRKDPMLGVRLNGEPKAYLFDKMGRRAVINDEVGGVDIVVIWDEDSHLALPYSSVVDGQQLIFDIAPDDGFPFSLIDDETGSLWDINGVAIDGPLAGTQLAQVPAHNSFWFAWVTFWEETSVWKP